MPKIVLFKDTNGADISLLDLFGDKTTLVSYAKDLNLVQEDGSEWAGIHVYKRDGDTVRLFWMSEMSLDMADPGQDPRDAPDIAPLWSILDLTPEGRGKNWYPKLSY